jgi:thiol peroxidase
MNKITFDGYEVTIKGNETKVGEKAPNFTAMNQDLGPFNFYEDTEDKVKIISAFPSLDTGVCSIQTQTFNEKASKLKDDLTVISISVDLPFAQKRFCVDEGIDNSIVVSDHKNLDFGQKYGFIIDEYRLLTRGVIVVDKNNVIRYVEYVNEVTNHPDYDKAMEVAKNLIKGLEV